CSTLKKAVGKAPCGSADVETSALCDFNMPMIEGCLKLEASTTNEGPVFAQEADCGVRSDGGAGFVDLLFVHQHPAREDQGARPFAALDEVAINQQEIDPRFGRD